MHKLIVRSIILGFLTCGVVIANEQTVMLSIPGMNCPVCPITIKKSLQQVEGVKMVDIVFSSKTADVLFDDQYTNINSILKAMENVGYPSYVLK